MTYAPTARRDTTATPGGRVLTAVRALSAPRTWQATFHLVTGMLLGGAIGAVLCVVGVLGWAAGVSLIARPTDDPVLSVFYAFVTLATPVAILLGARFATALQRERFRALLGVDIPTVPPPGGTGWRRLVRPWTAASTWRQLAYHILAGGLATSGGVVVLLCWAAPVLAALWMDQATRTGTARAAWFAGAAALLLAAPWVARGMVLLDTLAARILLGPGRAEQLVLRVETLARSREQLVEAADAERRRIERDLHDGVQQRLVSLAMNLGMARAAYGGEDVAPEIREVIAVAHDEATTALAELRAFVRGLHPAVLDDRGLDAALSGVVARVPLPVRLRVDVATRCSPSIEAIAYFTVSEALTNVVKHADASRAEVTVTRSADRLSIVVTDDGRGGASASGSGTGLVGLAQRAAAVDGTLTVSSPPGGPTTVTVDLPCE